MKNLNIFFELLLFPFLLVLRYSLTLKGNVHSKQKHCEQVKSKKLHCQFLTYIIPILFFTLLATSPLSAATPGGVDCNNSVTVGSGTTSGTLVAADNHNDDYFKFITGGPGELQINFNSTVAIKFYAGTTGCPISNYFLEIDPANTAGLGLITLDANTTIYIHVERKNNNANYNFTIDFTPAPTELDLPPTICYDYSYRQGDTYFTEDNNGSFEPRIAGNNLDPSLPITVEFYIQNTDAADNNMENTIVNIFDINTTQATYISGSTSLIKPGELTATAYTDINASDSYNNDILIGDVESRDFFYVYYDLDPTGTVIDIPLNIRVGYNVTYHYGTASSIDIHYETVINSEIPLCNNNSFNYTPAYGIFNMEDSVLTYDNKYNLPTQTANRVGDFVVAAYEADNIYLRKQVNTPVAIELIDAGKHDDAATSCREPDSVVGSRIWVIFDDNASRTDFNYTTINTAVNDPILDDILSLSTAEGFYDKALQNAAFKLSYNGAGNGELVQLDKVECAANVPEEWCYNVLNFTEIIHYNGGNCIQDVDGRPGNIDRIPQFCNNAGLAGASAMTPAELAVCMECIYGFDVNYLCSRDNFAIRPESYRISLNDQDQNDITQQSPIALNDDLGIGTNQDRNHTNNTPYHVAAGYNYALQIRATNHQDDNPTPGYDVGFFIDGNDSQRSFRLAWQASADDTKCNDIEDHNKSLSLINGGADLNLSSSQIGKYDLTIFDKLWTRVDWDPTVMIHHTTGQGAGYFLTGTDCVQNTSYVPSKNNTQTGTNGDDLANVSGCDITSNNHTNSDNGNKYKDIALRVHPYKFDLAGLTIGAGPTNNRSFIYINTLDETFYPNDIDENMSYNIQGTFFAAGYTSDKVSNFVDGCYAEDVNMTLKHTYLSDIPATTDNLTYDLIDYNTTNPSITYPTNNADNDRNQSTFDKTLVKDVNTDLLVRQKENIFDKTMKGAITMDLGFNFKRENNATLNPRKINFSDFNITLSSGEQNINVDLKNKHTIFGDRDELDQNVTFLYGRAKPGKTFYDDVTDASIVTPISTVVFCDLDYIECLNRGLDLGLLPGSPPIMEAQTNEAYWWKSLNHNNQVNRDGNIVFELGTPTEGSGTPTISATSATIISEGEDSTITVGRGPSPTLPLNVPINFVVNDPANPPVPLNYTDRWLIYNEYSATQAPSPFYKVKFIDDSMWSGVGKTGSVVGNDASSKKTKRLDW